MSTSTLPPAPGAATMFAADATARRDGIVITSFGNRAADGEMVVTEAMLNGHGTCHGGQIFLFADTVFSCACNSDGPAVAAKADIVFVAPAHLGDVLRATAHEQASFGRNGVFDVTVTRADGTLIALFRAHSRSR
ncbi:MULTISPECIES: hydroxyphenylacetyl-CoA thioesterase PaaI [unclassified Nocardioides]|uniref:hydroxyphenylacetyl-CoA thioesterase PaaI n=1 Tax=unclassified Nocardioides TaxID=2615069 RepID=UPI0006F677FB|nr:MULTISPECIES: hydroxyphenylacetyl-CoA thioesterase PaaI [unclassified Nocardioides]KQY63477.1 hypothetical protein ASD30_00160 [Nocardioides sp. Root140]KRF17571.1 hypothetical protein ASH02_25270 [Nocardioides sp. Soil796]